MWKNNIAMVYSNELEKYDYGENHPMKPERIPMTYDLLNGYKLLSQFYLYRAYKCTKEDLTIFHSEEYINFMRNYGSEFKKKQDNNPFNIGA